MAETAKLSKRSSSAGVPAPGPTGILVPNRVFIGGLPAIPSQTEIAELFAKYGVVTDVKIVPTENSRTKPYGFVTFQTVEEANKALQDTNIILRDRKLNVAAAYRKQSTAGGHRSNGPLTPSTPGYPSSVFSTPSMERVSVPLQSVPVAQQPEVWYTTQAPGPGGSAQNFVYYRNACGQYQYTPLPVSPIQQPVAHYGGSHGNPYWIQNSPMQPCYMVYDQSMSGGVGDSTNSLVTLTPPSEETCMLDEAEAAGASASHAAAQEETAAAVIKSAKP